MKKIAGISMLLAATFGVAARWRELRRAGARTPASPTSAGSRRPDARTGRARRLTFLLPVLALLAGAFSLFAPAPVEAQTTPVWSATLDVEGTTGYSGTGNSFRGCANGLSNHAFLACSSTTVLSEDQFNHPDSSTTNTIDEIGQTGTNLMRLRLSGLTGAQTKTRLAGLTLNVGSSNTFAINDGTASGNFLTWTTSSVIIAANTDVAVSLTPSGPSAPSAPTNLVVGPGNGQLGLTWTAPSGTLTGYDVHYTSAPATGSGSVANSVTTTGSNPATAWVAVTRSGTTASQTISPLTNNTAYRVRVRAKNSVGAGAWVFGTGTPTAKNITLTASSTTVTEGSTVTITVTTGETVPSTLQFDLAVPYTVALGSAETGDVPAGDGSVFVARGGTTATFEITTSRDQDADDDTFTVSLGTPPTGWTNGSPSSVTITIEEDEPSGLTVTPGDLKLDLSWTAPASNANGYGVDYTSAPATGAGSVANDADATGNDPAMGWVGVTRSGATASQSITGLSGGTLYRVRVRALDGATPGAWLFATGTPTTPQPPAAPTNLAVSAVDTQLGLTWTAPSGTLTGYDVHYTSAASGTVANSAAASGSDASAAWVAVSRTETSPPTASQTISSLTNNTAYRVRVRAKNSAGNSDWVFGTGTPVPIAGPGVPRNVKIVPGNNQVTLSWQAPASWGDWAASQFQIQEFFTVATGGRIWTNNKAGTYRTFSRGANAGGYYASNGQTETWKIRAVSLKAGSDSTNRDNYRFSDWVSVTVTVGLPGVPTGLTATPGDGALGLAWRAPAQNGGGITGYDVHYTSAASGTVSNTAAASGSDPSAAWVDASHSGTAVSQTISGLPNGTAWRWRVRAKNTHGAGGWAFGTGQTPPAVQFSAADLALGENYLYQPSVTLTVNPAPASAIQVKLAHAGGTPAATAGTACTGDADYVPPPSSVTIPAGQASINVNFSVCEDRVVENSEKATFTIAAGTGYVVGTQSEFALTIWNVSRPVNLSASPNPVPEGQSVTVTATRSSAGPAVTVPVTVTSGTAEPGDHGTLTSISIAENATTGTAAIAANHDADTLDETFTVALSGEPPLSHTWGPTPSVEVTIDDDDMPTVSLSVDQDRPTEGESVTLTATLSSPISGAVAIPLTVDLGTAESGDITVPGTITIAAGATTGTGTLATHHDAGHLDETFTVRLGSTLPNEVLPGSPASVALTIADDEGNIRVSFAEATMELCEGGPKKYLPELVLSRRPDRDSGIWLTGNAGTAEPHDHDFLYVGLISIKKTTYAWYGSPKAIQANHDGDWEFEEFTVEIDREKLPNGFVAAPDRPTKVTVTIVDDDLYGQDGCNVVPARISVTDDGVHENADRDFMRFVLTLDRAAPTDVTVDYRTVNGTAVAGSDYEATSGRLTFGHGYRRQEIQVPVFDDNVEDSGETFRLVLSNPQGAVIEKGEATGTIYNDEHQGAEVQLTAAFERAPARHEGSAFWFDLRFKEALGETANAPSAASFTVKNGSISRVWKVEDGLWRLLVAPETRHDVTVTLEGGLACDAAGAVCAADGRALGNSPTATVAGPDGALSADADLSALSVEGAPGAQGSWSALDVGTFAAATTAYSATVPHGTTHVRLTATAGGRRRDAEGGRWDEPDAVTGGSGKRRDRARCGRQRAQGRGDGRGRHGEDVHGDGDARGAGAVGGREPVGAVGRGRAGAERELVGAGRRHVRGRDDGVFGEGAERDHPQSASRRRWRTPRRR